LRVQDISLTTATGIVYYTAAASKFDVFADYRQAKYRQNL